MDGAVNDRLFSLRQLHLYNRLRRFTCERCNERPIILSAVPLIATFITVSIVFSTVL